MDKNNIEQLTKLAKVFNADNVITAKEIEQVLVGIMQIMNSFKKDNEKLSTETKDAVRNLYSQLAAEHDKMVKELETVSEKQNTKLQKEFDSKSGMFDEALTKVKKLLEEIKAIEVKDGKDADEEMIIDSVLAKIKLPEYKEIVLDDGEEIVAKINELSTTEDAFKIDASHIKNLPTGNRKGYSPTVLGNAVDLNQSARADGYAIVWDDTNKNFKFATAGGGAWSSITGTPTEIPYFDAVGNGTSDATHTLLVDGTLNLQSTFGDVTGSFVQRVEPTLSNAGIWGTTTTNNSTGATITQGIIDGTNILDVGSDSIFATLAEFPATNTAAQQFVGSAGIFQGVSVGSDVFIEENITSAGYQLGVYDLATPAGSNIFAYPTGAGLLSRDLSSYPTGYDVYSLYGTVYADDTGVTSRVQTGKNIVDYVQNGTIISAVIFTGAGLNDFTPAGDYTGAYTGTYTVTCIGNDGARVVFNGGMTTGTQFAVGEVVTGSISGATAVVSNGTSDTRIWAYDVTGTGFVNGDILTGDQGNVSTAVTTAGNAPGVGDLFEVNYTDIQRTNVQWLTGNQAVGTPFNGIGGITYEFAAATGHTATNSWAFTASANYVERLKLSVDAIELQISNATSGETAGYFVTDTAGTLSADFGWNSGVGQGAGIIASVGGIYIQSQDAAAQNDATLQLLSGVANTMIWDADTTDTIITKLEQSQDILGLGAFSGTALTWEDTNTQVQGIVGAVDGTGSGLFPGSTILATQNTTTGASSSLSTNYDNVSNVATAIANVTNGDFDSGYEFNDASGLIRYRNATTGLESKLIVQDGNTYLSYKALTASDEWQAVLGDGVFSFSDRDASKMFLNLDATNGIYQVGDIDGALNSTFLTVNDATQVISSWSEGTNKNVLVGKTLSLPDNTVTSVFEVALPVGAMTGGFFTATIIATDGTDYQAHSDHATYAAVNKAGTITATMQASNADDAVAVSAGTLGVTWTINTATAGKITIEVTANSSLAAPTITLTGLNIDNNNGHVVTIL